MTTICVSRTRVCTVYLFDCVCHATCGSACLAFRVCPGMQLEVVSPRKALATEVTHTKGFSPMWVRARMRRQVVGRGETLSTGHIHVGFLPRVGPSMLRQCGGLDKAFPQATHT